MSISLLQAVEQATGYNITIFQFNPSGTFESLVSIPNLQQSNFPHLVENLDLGYYVARVDARLPDGLVSTALILQYYLNFEGKLFMGLFCFVFVFVKEKERE